MHGSTNEEHLDYAQSIEFMGQRHNRQLIQQTEAFRQRGIGDFSLLRGQLFHQRIIGINQTTIGGLIMSPRLVCADTWFGMFCIPLPEFAEVRWVLGDTTVPLRSGWGAGWQNDKGYGDDNEPIGSTASITVNCPFENGVQYYIERMLEGKLCRNPSLQTVRGRDWTPGVRRTGDAP